MKNNFTNDYEQKATRYGDQNISGTLALGYQALEKIFKKYVHQGCKALDFGCGGGRSTRYLQQQNFLVHGVDIHPAMINQCKLYDSTGFYELLQHNKIPQRDRYYDLVFSSLVFLEMPTLRKMKESFAEIYRTMKFGGTFILLTVNDDFYNHEWLSVDTNYPENLDLFSGKKVKIKLKELNLELHDYYWTKDNYRKIASETGFTIVEEILPKADNEEQPWIAEKVYPPYVIFVMQKTASLIDIDEKTSSLKLTPIIGKGHFRESDRAVEEMDFLDGGTVLTRNKYSKATLLLQPADKWNFHKNKAEEIFAFVEGNDLILHVISKEGVYEKILIGKENDNSVMRYKVTAGTWLAEETEGKTGYTLIEVTTCPAFHPDDIEEASANFLKNLVKDNMEISKIIDKFTLINPTASDDKY